MKKAAWGLDGCGCFVLFSVCVLRAAGVMTKPSLDFWPA